MKSKILDLLSEGRLREATAALIQTLRDLQQGAASFIRPAPKAKGWDAVFDDIFWLSTGGAAICPLCNERTVHIPKRARKVRCGMCGMTFSR